MYHQIKRPFLIPPTLTNQTLNFELIILSFIFLLYFLLATISILWTSDRRKQGHLLLYHELWRSILTCYNMQRKNCIQCYLYAMRSSFVGRINDVRALEEFYESHSPTSIIDHASSTFWSMITFLYLYYLKRIWLLGNLATENSARLLRPSLWGSPFWHSIHKVKYFFKLGVRFKIKNGSCILFWTDWWTGDSPLSAWFMCLFDIAAMGGSTIPLARASAQACRSTRDVLYFTTLLEILHNI
jgi:hypothetical protein